MHHLNPAKRFHGGEWKLPEMHPVECWFRLLVTFLPICRGFVNWGSRAPEILNAKCPPFGGK